MDLSTIKDNLNAGQYKDPWDFCDDMWLMFENAWLYNRKNSKVYKYCTKVGEILQGNCFFMEFLLVFFFAAFRSFYGRNRSGDASGRLLLRQKVSLYPFGPRLLRAAHVRHTARRSLLLSRNEISIRRGLRTVYLLQKMFRRTSGRFD